MASLLLLVGLFILIILPRLLVVADTVTIDEDKWLTRSGNFRYALQTRNWQDTYQREHPGVSVMWAGTLGLSFLLRNNQLAFDPTSQPELAQLLAANGYDLLDALVAARVVMILVNGLVLVASFVYLRRLLGTTAAIICVLLIALSPFYTAHTQLLHLDGLVSLLMMLSILAFVQYVNGRHWHDLIISGAAAGMASLTKAPGFLLIPVIASIWFLLIFLTRRDLANPGWTMMRDSIVVLGVWASAGLVTFIILWPAMWVSPWPTLSRMFSAVVSYTTDGHNSPIFFNGTIFPEEEQFSHFANFYPVTYMWRTTPIILAGLVIAVIGVIKGRYNSNLTLRNTMLSLFVAVALILVGLNMGNKKFDRYLLPVYGPLALIAAIGWRTFATWLANHRPFNNVIRFDLVVLVLVLFAQSIFLYQSYPYYLSFYNPLLGGSSQAPKVMMIGWGEGLDAAAEYLNQKPGAASLRVASWYRPSFAYFFAGRAIDIPPFVNTEQMAKILGSDYIVIYASQWQRNLPSELLAELNGKSAEYVFWHNGLEYARVYKLPLAS